MRFPDYQGGGLVNLVAEIEQRLTGTAPSPGLSRHLASTVPEALSYIFVLFDGLGDAQLEHSGAKALLASRVGSLDASFSTQTTVNTSTLATGLPPSQHGLIAYQLRLNTSVLNTIYWYLDDGKACDLDPVAFLPAPNLSERLAHAGRRVVATEPEAFLDSPLDRVLYRGSTVVGVADSEIDVALDAVRTPGTLALVYLPHVDAAGHAGGQGSGLYADAVRHVSEIWSDIISRLPEGVAAVGTADHGHVDIADDRRIALPQLDDLILYGDNRVVYVSGPPTAGADLARSLPATWVAVSQLEGIWGPEPYHPRFTERLPDGLLIADDGYALVPYGTVDTMVGHHGGVTEAELRIPLLVAS
ncbi:MAG: hypothetical protein GWP04_10365 [Gammaproteobacteria bacterium]|nr:hypothetical protein [Gammaproteobacteria bacterium]